MVYSDKCKSKQKHSLSKNEFFDANIIVYLQSEN